MPHIGMCEALAPPESVCLLCSHNKGAIQRLFLGSTSDYCAKHCPQPLVIVR